VPEEMYFYGVWSKDLLGHFLYRPSGSRASPELTGVPFSVFILDSHLIPHRPRSAKTQDGWA
jgi:hypothetical protein